MAQPPVGHDILSSLQEIESLGRVCAFVKLLKLAYNAI